MEILNLLIRLLPILYTDFLPKHRKNVYFMSKFVNYIVNDNNWYMNWRRILDTKFSMRFYKIILMKSIFIFI